MKLLMVICDVPHFRDNDFCVGFIGFKSNIDIFDFYKKARERN